MQIKQLKEEAVDNEQKMSHLQHKVSRAECCQQAAEDRVSQL